MQNEKPMTFNIPLETWPESVCAEADRLVNTDRRKSYGHPYENFERTVNTFASLTGIKMTPEQGALFMICIKLARESYAEKRDTRVDICGYVKVLDVIIEYSKENSCKKAQ